MHYIISRDTYCFKNIIVYEYDGLSTKGHRSFHYFVYFCKSFIINMTFGLSRWKTFAFTQFALIQVNIGLSDMSYIVYSQLQPKCPHEEMNKTQQKNDISSPGINHFLLQRTIQWRFLNFSERRNIMSQVSRILRKREKIQINKRSGTYGGWI